MNKINSLLAINLCLSGFLCMGWYFAESDNEILRKELESYTGKEVRK